MALSLFPSFIRVNNYVWDAGTSAWVKMTQPIAGSNPFDQDLDTTDPATFLSVTAGASVFTGSLTAPDFILTTGHALKTDTTTAHTGLLQAYDVDGTAYKTFGTLTNGNTPDFTIAPPAGGTVTLQASTFKSSDGSAGATGSGTVITAITVKNGLVTAITVS